MKRKRAYISVILLFLFTACEKEDKDYEYRTSYFHNINTTFTKDSVLTCVTFNIHLGFRANHDPWNKDQSGADQEQLRNIADILRQADPDIIALQEVPRNRYNAVIKNFVEALAAELDMNYAFGAHGYNDPYEIYPVNGEWGNGILTRFEILGINNKQVEYKDKWEKRSLLDVTLKINDSVIVHAISLHHIPSNQGIPNTATYVEKIKEPVIMMGDYNYIGEISAFNNIGLKDSDSTYMSLKHGIDRIFISVDYFRVLELGSLKDTLWTSDHPANYAILGF